MRFFTVPCCFALSFLSIASAQSIKVDEFDFASGRFGLVATSDSDLVLILQRLDGDTLAATTTTRVGMAIGQAGVPQPLNEFLASGQPKGFFEVVGTDLSTFLDDSDSDGIKDLTELQAAEFLHPLDISDAVSADVFDLVLDASVSNGVPATGAGNIEAPNDADIYRFNATGGTGVFVDVVSSASELSLHDYRIIDPYGNTLKTSRFGLSDMGPVSLPHDGEYLLLVGDTSSTGIGTYGIHLSVIPEPQFFSIAIGDTIAIDDPQPGAGTIEAPGAFDSYFFTANAGDKVFLDTLSYSGTNSLNYRLLDPTSTQLDTQQFNLGDMGTVELPLSGTYILEVGEIGNDDTGTYSIGLTAVPDPDSFSISIGDTISDGQPGIGAGNIEVPGAFDTYTFTGTTGQKVFLNTLSFAGTNSIDYRLFDPSGNQLERQQFNLGDMGTIELPETGTYTLEVGEADLDATGTYSLAITNIPSPDSFVISIGDTISDGQPGTGAGNIEVPGAFDIYTFSGTTGQKVFLNTLSYSGTNSIDYRLFDPSGNQLDRQQFNLGDMGTIELPETGTYTLEVGEAGLDNTGTYSLAITNVPSPDSFAISIGDTISDGLPGTGAGNIEVPGGFDTYTFSGTAGDKVFLATLSYSGVNSIDYRLFDPSGNQLERQQFNLGDMGTIELPETGTYTLEVGEIANDQTGTYSIAITAIPPPDTFVITTNDNVTGELEVPGAFDIYTFTATAGEQINITNGDVVGLGFMKYRLYAPSGSLLDTQQFNLGDMGVVVLPETGIYSLEVGDAPSRLTGTYQLSINPWSP